MIHWIYLIRDVFTAQSTHGEWFFGDKCQRFAYSLEDTVRADGVKVKGHTAIPGGTEECPEVYDVTISMSTRFKREMVMLSNTNKSWLIRKDNVEFKGVRVHGGNHHGHTDGCPLCAKNRHLGIDKIQGTMEKEFTAKVRELMKTGTVKVAVINKKQDN